MEQANRQSLNVARRLLSHEAGGGESPNELADAADSVCHRLSGQLSALIGPDGVRALLSRALRMAEVDPSLGQDILQGVEVDVQSAVCLKGLHERVQVRDPAEVERAITAIFANFIWLLGTFIGFDLTLRELRWVWPEVPLGENICGSQEREK